MKKKDRGDFAASSRLLLLAALAFPIGALSTCVAYVLIKLIYFFTNLSFFHSIGFDFHSPAVHHLGYWVIIVPVLGGIVVGFMARYGSEKIRGHGIPEALEAILFKKSIIEPKVAVLKPLSSAIAIGTGGPFGAEGPIIMTGGALGSLIAQFIHLTSAERKTLLVAGAAAGMSAVFASPIAAVLLAVELLLFEWKPRSVVPVTIASVVAFVLRPYFLGAGPLFPFSETIIVTPKLMLVVVVVGLIAGLFSTVLSSTLYKVEDFFIRLPIHWMWWPAIGGIVVGVGGYLQPQAFGVGYDIIDQLIHNQMLPKVVAALVIAKAFIWLIALGSGTSGGVLAPLLIMGCGLGTIEGALMFPQFATILPLLSMCAVLGGTMRVPFTAVLFGLELTHNLDAIMPLLVASMSAYALSVLIMKRSILTEKVARRGLDIYCEYSIDPFERLRVKDVMSKEVHTISAEAMVKDVLNTYFNGKHKYRSYPVLDKQGQFVGIVGAADLLSLEITGDGLERRISTIMKTDITKASPDESCRIAAERMARAGVGRLPVVCESDPNKIVGILNRSDLLRARFLNAEEEQVFERPLRVIRKEVFSKSA